MGDTRLDRIPRRYATLAALAGTLSLAAAPAPAQLPQCSVGMHVPRVSPLNYGATILAIDAVKGSYQVKSDRDGLVDWVPASLLRSSCAGVEARPVTTSYFVGNWSLFVGPTPHHATIDGKGYLVVGTGAHVPPVQINADGSYIWTVDSRTRIAGHWRPMAEHELKYGTKPPAILLLAGEDGRNWEVWRAGVNAANNRDAIFVERMDLGLSYRGTRLP